MSVIRRTLHRGPRLSRERRRGKQQGYDRALQNDRQHRVGSGVAPRRRDGDLALFWNLWRGGYARNVLG